MSRRAAPTLSSKSALAPRFRGLPRPCQRLEVGRYHSPPHPTYLGGESPRYGGRGGPSLRPRVQGGAVRWTFKVPPWTRYLGEVPWHGGTWHFDLRLAFTITLIVRRKTSVVRIGVGSRLLPNVPAEARARPQRCGRLTSPMIRLLMGICQHPSPLMSRGGLSLATPAGSFDVEARAASEGYMAACNRRRVLQIRRYTPRRSLARWSWGVEYSRPRRKDSP